CRIIAQVFDLCATEIIDAPELFFRVAGVANDRPDCALYLSIDFHRIFRSLEGGFAKVLPVIIGTKFRFIRKIKKNPRTQLILGWCSRLLAKGGQVRYREFVEAVFVFDEFGFTQIERQVIHSLKWLEEIRNIFHWDVSLKLNAEFVRAASGNHLAPAILNDRTGLDARKGK